MWFQFLTSRNEENSSVIYVLSQYLARNINANLAKNKENTENIKRKVFYIFTKTGPVGDRCRYYQLSLIIFAVKQAVDQ